jgi:geranylgeranyl diphosphate synthase type I
VELLHNFSLIHDDIEDGDAERRHRSTVWKVWGAPQAINVGDGMFFLAHQSLQRLAADESVGFETFMTVFRRFEAACLALCQGQFLDMSFETRLDVTVAEYLFMVQGKTAHLFAASAEMGALLGADGPATAAHFGEFGIELGLAFQVWDDVLGIWGDPAVTGKPAANDLRQRKKNWPVVYALEHAVGPARATLQSFYQGASADEAGVARVLDVLDGLGVRQKAETLVQEYHSRALAALDRANGREPAATWLRALAQTLIGRET